MSEYLEPRKSSKAEKPKEVSLEERYGRNTDVSDIYIRHTLKASGMVGSAGAISTSLSASEGLERSKKLGAHLAELSEPSPEGVVKLGSSNLGRTYETAQALKAGYIGDATPGNDQVVDFSEQEIQTWAARRRSIMQSRSLVPKDVTEEALEEKFKSLPFDQQVAIAQESASAVRDFAPRMPSGLSALSQPRYIEKWDAEKRKLMSERGVISPDVTDAQLKEKFNGLSADEQAKIAEDSEIPVMEEWINNTESELAKLYPLEEWAAKFAVLVDRNRKSVGRLYSGSSIDRLNTTHKTVMEPLLMKILVLPDGSKPKTLADIGGQIGLNDGWALRTKTDANGEPASRLFMYRVKDFHTDNPRYEQSEYKVDIKELERLADIGVKVEHEQRKAEIAKNPELWKLKES